jgi:hypothetical protein
MYSRMETTDVAHRGWRDNGAGNLYVWCMAVCMMLVWFLLCWRVILGYDFLFLKCTSFGGHQ